MYSNMHESLYYDKQVLKILLLFSVTQEPYDTDKMSEVFVDQFCNRAFSVEQPVNT